MTFFETAGQSGVFLLLLYAGAAAGVLYDAISPARRRCPRPLAVILDGSWCLLAAALCALALAAGGENQLRLYALLGMVCGAGIYCLGVRRLILGAVRLLRRFTQRKNAAS